MLRQVHKEKIFVMTSVLTELVKMAIFIKANPLFFGENIEAKPLTYLFETNEDWMKEELSMSLMALENCSCSWWVLLPVPAAEPVSCSLIFSSAAALKKFKNIFFNKLRFIEAWSKLVSWFRLITQTVKLIFTSQGWQSTVNRETPPIVTHG